MLKVHFVYGWSEGPWQSRKLRLKLEQQGFAITKDVSQADIVIAHSLGCYLIPRANQAKLILLIGLPYWPGRSIAISVLKNIVANIRNSDASPEGRWWFKKMGYNVWYIVSRPLASYHAVTKRKEGRLPRASERQQILLIRNKDDTFGQPEALRDLAKKNDYEYIEIPVRHHEDCWLHPESYINLIKKYYG